MVAAPDAGDGDEDEADEEEVESVLAGPVLQMALLESETKRWMRSGKALSAITRRVLIVSMENHPDWLSKLASRLVLPR